MSDGLAEVRSAARDAPASSSYDSYWKPDVEYLTALPSHWDAPRLKYAVESGRGSSGLIKSEAHDSPAPGLYPAFSASGQDVWVEKPTHSGPGIVLSAVGARCGKAFRASGEWGVVANTHVFHPRNQFDRDFIWFLLNDEGFWEKGGTAQPYVQVSASLNKRIPAPPLPEQERIASFLNSRTGLIDDLIAKKERLIELLEEKRTALITQAVTKGLDPDVPMKDSSVEWLGEIPEHWTVRRISSMTSKLTNGYVGPTRDILVDEGVRYLQSLHIKSGSVKFERKPYFVDPSWAASNQKSQLREGDVVIVQTGDIGQVACIPSEFDGAHCHALIIARCLQGVATGQYLSLVLQSSYGEQRLKWSQTGALHPHLECGHVREIPIPLPPIEEQRKIVKRVHSQQSRLRRLKSRARDAQYLAREYRSALITAAVTGQIDVRDHAA